MPATTPANPASVSGPGALSKRTDSGPAQKLRDLPDAQYGEAQTFRDSQRAAPLAQTPQIPTPAPAARASAVAGPALPTPFHAPTEHPDEPVTAPPLAPSPGFYDTKALSVRDFLDNLASNPSAPDSIRALAGLAQRRT